MVGESRSEPLGASSNEGETISLDKQDDNANPSPSLSEIVQPEEQQLIDNFRFLSIQGLIVDQSEVAKASDSVAQSSESSIPKSEAVVTTESNTLSVESTPIASQASPPDPV